MKKVIYLKTGKEMWFFGMDEGKYCIGLSAHSTILVTKDQIRFVDD
jgi:hypothetical protein